MHRRFRSTLVACALITALGACGGGDKEGDVEARVADQLVEAGGFSEKDADCFAGVLIDELGEDEVKDRDFSAEAPKGGTPEEIVAATQTASTKCDIDLGSRG
jgi:hypothetical protein